MQKVRAGIVGAASLLSSVLLRLLALHRHVEIVLLVSETKTGKKVEDVHRELRGAISKKLVPYNPREIAEQCEVVFLCKSHGEFWKKTGELIALAKRMKSALKVIDLSADYRLHDPKLYPMWYGFEHKNARLLRDAVYGLPEIHARDIKEAELVANPGCYPTCVLLGAAPLFQAKVVDGTTLIVDACCGVSGAGLRPNERNLAMYTMENILPYRVASHPHAAEMEQELTHIARERIQVTFVPHVVSFKYGMLTNIYLRLKKRADYKSVVKMYQKFYQGKDFVRLLPEGEYPQIRNVVGTNLCEIGLVYDQRTRILIVMSVIDNLMKGGSGQAVQNMNLMFGLEEKEGLPSVR
jgi:N-acetyl-gamma-glutamyl-phosphate reductase